MDGDDDSWVEAEIERQLNTVSLEDLENEINGGDGATELTPGRVESSEMPGVDHAEGGDVMDDVSTLFGGYLTTLHCEHQGVEVLMSDAKDALANLQKSSSDFPLVYTSIEQTLEEDKLAKSKASSGISEGASDHVCAQSHEEEVNVSTVECEESSYTPQPACEAHCNKDDVIPANSEVVVEESEWMRELEQEQIEKQKALAAMIAEGERKKKERDKILAERAALEAARRLKAVVVLQTHWRGYAAWKQWQPLLTELRERRIKVEMNQNAASVVLQAHWRRHTARKRYKLLLAELRERRIKEEMNSKLKAAVVLQTHWRGRVGCMKRRALKIEQRKVVEETIAKLQAAVCIQKHWKGYVMRKDYHKKLGQKKLEDDRLFHLRVMQEKHRAAVCIQTHWRAWITKSAYLKQLEEIKAGKKMEADQNSSPIISSSSNTKDFDAECHLDTQHIEDKMAETVSPNTATIPSPGKKLTITKRITSALKLLKQNSEVSFSEPLSTPPPENSCVKSSSLPLIQATSKHVCPEKLQNKSSPVDELSLDIAGEDEQDAALAQEEEAMRLLAEGRARDAALAQEEEAMRLLAEGRAREEMIAQLSRERMDKMITAEELAQAARSKRSHVTYRQELDHACVPMSPFAWAGVIEEKWAEWRKAHATWMWPCSEKQSPAKTTTTKPKRTPAGSKGLSNAQLLATSAKGTSLTEVANVIVYRSRAPVDLGSLSKCPLLHCLSLTKCGVTSLSGMADCKCLLELAMTSNAMEHIDCTAMPQLLFLDLTDNRLASIHGLDACATLLELNLAENRIARMAGVKGCTRLQKLIVDSNLVINCRGLEDVPMLQDFSCAENHLPSVQGLHKCSLLQQLNLNQNNLQEIPTLPNHVLLRELHLNENSLSDLSPVSNAWLPLLQTLTLANNCITEMVSLSCLVMLQTLDLSNNSLYDLPVLLQSIKACFRLKEIHLYGNPITEETNYRSYLLKAVPHLEKLDDKLLTNRKAVKLAEAVTSSRLMQLCTKQISEQDEMKTRHQQEIEAVSTEELSNPQTAIKLVKSKAGFCFAYERLLISHLREHEAFEPQREGRQIAERHARPPPGPALQTVRAAIVIQKVWRGRRDRWLVALKRQRLDRAATVIQAHFRGYGLRKRLREALESIRQQAAAEGVEFDNEGDEFDYEEEVKLDYLDESLLDAELGPLSPPPAELLKISPHFRHRSTMSDKDETKVTRSKKTVTLPAYGIPGAVDSEVSIEVWRQTQQELQKHGSRQTQPLHPTDYGRTVHEDSTATGPCENIGSRSGDLHSTPPSGQKVQLAWGSTVQLDDGENSSSGENQDVPLTDVKKDCISNEWGFKSSMTTDLMLKRAKRQKKLKAAAIKRKKLHDPDERLALFRKQGGGSGVSKPTLERGAQSYLTPGYGTVQPSPVRPLLRREAKDESLYRWVHTQRVVQDTQAATASIREVRLREDVKSKDQQLWYSPKPSIGVLPQLEPHVLAGHAPRLVSSEAQNLLLGSSSPQHSSQREKKSFGGKKPF